MKLYCLLFIFPFLFFSDGKGWTSWSSEKWFLWLFHNSLFSHEYNISLLSSRSGLKNDIMLFRVSDRSFKRRIKKTTSKMKILWSTGFKHLVCPLVIICCCSLERSLPFKCSNHITTIQRILQWWRNGDIEESIIIIMVIDIPVTVRRKPQSPWILIYWIILVSDMFRIYYRHDNYFSYWIGKCIYRDYYELVIG